MHWLSAGKQPNGMVIMQGFDRGLFGAITRNWLPLLPGVDVVATSTGRDYAKAAPPCQARGPRGDDGRRHDLLNLANPRSREAWLASIPRATSCLRRRPSGDDSDAERRVACVTWNWLSSRRRGSYSTKMLR